jgi:stearoyl-CoA desaturase (delta-9 desaturase)
MHAFTTLVVSFIAVLAGVGAVPWLGFNWLDLSMLSVMYALTMTGVAVGFHLLFSHRAFRAGPGLRASLAILGSMAGQGSVLYWASNHRLHHGRSDQPGDLHSPWVDGAGRTQTALRGLWHAHLGWMFAHDPANHLRLSKDLLRDTLLTRINQLYYSWLALGVLLPSLVGYALAGPRGLWSGLIWGGLARMCFVQHATFSGNSICHHFGVHTYDTGDRSTNVVWLTIPTWGGAMHNTHHAFPSSALVGFEWWHLDIAGWIILALERLAVVDMVRRPTEQQRCAALMPVASGRAP